MKKILLGVMTLIVSLYMIGCDEPKDNEPAPPISITSPLDGSTVHELVSIIVQVHNTDITSKVEFLLDDSLHFTDTESPYKYDWNTTVYEDSSEHTIMVISYDNLDNVIGSQTIRLIVDNTNSFPSPVELFPITYQDGSFITTWSSSPDNDFSSYELYESHSIDMNESSMIYSTENKLDTSYVVTGINESEKKYYQVGVKDIWELQSMTGVQVGNSYKMFMRVFGGEREDIGYSVQQTSDGGYIITGCYNCNWNGDLWLIKTDSDGNEEWSQTLGEDLPDYGRSVKQTNDDGFIITGYTKTGINSAWLIKTDPQGNEEWNQQFTDYFQSVGFSVVQTSDGGFIVTGCTDCAGTHSVESDVLLVKTDSQGNEEWIRTFGGNSGEKGYSVQQTNDGGYIIVGDKVLDVWLIKTDSQGIEEWNRIFGNFYASGRSVKQTNDGGYIVTGFTSSDYYESNVWLIKTDSDGNEEWNSIFGETPNWGYSVQQTTDGGYIITGCTECNSTSGGDLWLIKTNPQGNEEWTRAHSISSDSYERGYSVQQAEDGGYIITGEAGDYGQGNLLLIKTDPDGDTVPFSE